MKSNQETTENEIGYRLQHTIALYFETQKKLAEISSIPVSSINEICSGKKKLNLKIAIKLQEMAGINANYLLNGVEPMMITNDAVKSYQPKYHGALPIKAQSTTLDLSRSITDYYVLIGANQNEHLDMKGKVDIVNVAFDGILKPFLIAVYSMDFCKKYNLPFGSDIVINEFYEEGHTVLALVDNFFIKAKYANNKLIDKANGKKYMINQKTKIVGQIYCCVIKEGQE